MGKVPREKMSRLNRAKQFAPFAALTGLDLLLAEKRREMGLRERMELSEEQQEELNEALKDIRKGFRVEYCWYRDGEYLQQKGVVTEHLPEFRILRIGDQRIAYEDLYQICRIQE